MPVRRGHEAGKGRGSASTEEEVQLRFSQSRGKEGAKGKVGKVGMGTKGEGRLTVTIVNGLAFPPVHQRLEVLHQHRRLRRHRRGRLARRQTRAVPEGKHILELVVLKRALVDGDPTVGVGERGGLDGIERALGRNDVEEVE
jgi:hypothetical protein